MKIEELNLEGFLQSYMNDYGHDERIAQIDDYDCVISALDDMEESLRDKFLSVFYTSMETLEANRADLWRDCLREAFENFLKTARL